MEQDDGNRDVSNDSETQCFECISLVEHIVKTELRGNTSLCEAICRQDAVGRRRE